MKLQREVVSIYYWLFYLLLLCGAGQAVNAQDAVFSQDYFTRFHSLTTQDGLSHHTVLDIIQDQYGMMWFATEGGLTKYDGVHFSVYTHFGNDVRSLSSDKVTSLAEDADGNLWVGTENGLNRYDRSNNSFIRYTVDKQTDDARNGLRNKHVKALYADSQGYLWVETGGGFLTSFDLNTGAWKHFKHFAGVQEGKYNYWHIFEDSNHDLWVGGRAMWAFRFSREKQVLEEFPVYDESGKLLLEGSCFVETQDKRLLSPNEGFLAVCNAGKKKFEYLGKLPLAATSALRDGEGNIWIGGNGGLICLQSDLKKGVLFKSVPSNESSLLFDEIKCLYQSPDGIIWIGTEKGVSFYSKNLNAFRYYRHLSGIPYSLSSDKVQVLMQDSDGLVWVGTGDCGTDTLSLPLGQVGNLTYSLLTKHLDEKTFGSERKVMEQYVRHGMIAGRSSFRSGAYSYQEFRNDTINYKLNENNVTALYQDKAGTVYIGLWSHVGFNTYNKKTGAFKRHALWSKKPDWLYPMLFEGNPFGSNWYNAFWEDRQGRFWCVTWEGFGLNLFNRATGEFEGKHYMPIDRPCRPRGEVSALSLDTCKRRMYMSGRGSYYGYYDFDSCAFKRYAEILPSDYLNRDIISRYYQYYRAEHIPIPMYFEISKMLWDGNGHMYLTDKQQILKHTLDAGIMESVYKTDKEGSFAWCISQDKQTVFVGHADQLFLLSLQKNKIDSLSSVKAALKGQNIKVLYEDGQRRLWIGTDDALWIYHRETREMEMITLFPLRKGLLNVSVIVEDADKGIYIGCAYGLVRLNDRRIVQEYRFDDVMTGIPGNSIRDIYPETTDRVWIATNDGLVLCGQTREKPVIFRNDEENPHSLSDNTVYAISPGMDNDLWLATGKGICVYHPRTGYFEDKSQPGNNCLTSRLASCILEDKYGNIWLGTTEKGLNVLHTATDTIAHYTYHIWDKEGIPDDCINCLLEDSRGAIWIGTDKGLCRYNRSTDNFSLVGCLKERQIQSIQEDREGHLWVSTEKGLYCISNDGQLKRVFYDFHGLQANAFHVRTSCRLMDGRLAFGGDYGFNLFRPDELLREVTARPITFSNFKVDDKVCYADVNDIRQIRLAYDENSFSMDFAAADYEYNAHLSYRYRLIPFDKDWVYTTSPFLMAKYTNLPHGSYRFEAEASNPFGEWTGDARKMDILIATPWYLQWWFFCLSALVLLLAVTAVIRYREKNLRKQKEYLEKQVKLRTEQLRMFFSIISHDLKGPCSQIEEMSGRLVADSMDKEKGKSVYLLQKTAGYVNDLLNKLLDWARIQHEMIVPCRCRMHLKKSVEDALLVLRPEADKKEIQLLIHIASDIIVYTDGNMLATILRNLVSNAIKYSYRNSEVIIQAENKNDCVEVCVTDSGVGMSEKSVKKLFRIDAKLRRFGTEREQGTGLGLIVVREFISLLEENIRVETEPDKGTSFIFTLHKTE